MRNLKLLHIGLVFLLNCWSVGGCSRPQGQVYETERISIHTYKIDGLMIRTGDLICTSTGGQSMPGGLFWKLFGELVYGDVDHIVVYVGPGGRCVEAGAKFRVLTFDIVDNTWDSSKMTGTRGHILDNLYGVAYPLAGRSLSSEEEARIRKSVARYCMMQAKAKKSYDPIFINSETEDAFYCS